MKKIFLTVAIVLCVTGTIMTSCESSAERKAERANERVEDAEEDLQEAQQDAKAAEAEYKQYQLDAENKMSQYELTISELKEKTDKTNSTMKSEYKARVAELEERNNSLKNRMKAFKYDTQENWQKFKREFEHDMDELGNALKEFTINNEG